MHVRRAFRARNRERTSTLQATASDKAITWQFDPPPGDTLSVSFGAEFEASEHPGSHDATVTVLDNDKPVVHTRFRTWEAP